MIDIILTLIIIILVGGASLKLISDNKKGKKVRRMSLCRPGIKWLQSEKINFID
jgi:hypothetical protein